VRPRNHSLLPSVSVISLSQCWGHTWLSSIKTAALFFKHFRIGETPVRYFKSSRTARFHQRTSGYLTFSNVFVDNGLCIRKTGCLVFFWEPRLWAWRTAVISGSSLLQVLIPGQQWSTYTLVSLEIAFFSTHTSSVDFPYKSVGSGASLQDSLCFLAYNQSWNSQVRGSKAGSIYPHNTSYIPTFQTHGPMPHPRSPRAWDQAYTSYVCVVYILSKFPRFVSVTGSNIFVQHAKLVIVRARRFSQIWL
jgi:hypothetical protein